MSIHQGATRDFHVDKRHTALELIGGYDSYPDMPQRRPDLTVRGGMRIKKTACFDGDLVLIRGDNTIEGNLTVLQNSYLANVYAENLFLDQFCVDNIEVFGNLSANHIFGNTAVIANVEDVCLKTEKINGNTATFVDTTTSNLTADCVTTTKLIGTTATLQTIDGLQKIGGPGDLLICNDGDLILQPTGDVILSNIAMDFDLTKSILSNVRAVQAAAGCPLELETDAGFKVVIAGGNGIDMSATDLCNGLNATFTGKVTTDDMCSNTLQTTGDVTVGGNAIFAGKTILAQLEVNDGAYVDGNLTVTGLIDPTGLVLDGQPSAPAVPEVTQGMLWVDISATPVELRFGEGGNTHTVFTTAVESTIDHGSISGLSDDDHPQYVHLGGRAGGQILYGGTSIDEDLILIPNTADGVIATTGNVVINGTIDSTDISTGALTVLGGVGVEKTLNVGRAIAGGIDTIPANAASVNLPNNKYVIIITPGTQMASFTVVTPIQTLAGQVLHVYNNSGYATTGVVMAAAAGATLVCDGSSWFQL